MMKAVGADVRESGGRGRKGNGTGGGCRAPGGLSMPIPRPASQPIHPQWGLKYPGARPPPSTHSTFLCFPVVRKSMSAPASGFFLSALVTRPAPDAGNSSLQTARPGRSYLWPSPCDITVVLQPGATVAT